MGIKKAHTGENTQLGGFWVSIPSWVVKHIKGDSVALHVLTCAIVYMNTHDQTLSTTYDVLAKDTGYNRRTVIRAMHRLVEIGVIRKTVKMGRYGKNMPNVYVITYNTAAAEAAPPRHRRPGEDRLHPGHRPADQGRRRQWALRKPWRPAPS